MFMNTRAIVLAAGKSTRFKTKRSKLLYYICGRTMILYPLKELEALNIPVTLVLGHQAEEVWAEVEKAKVSNVNFVVQEKQLGTGHAVECTKDHWDKKNILILNGDMPLVSKELFEMLHQEHEQSGAAVSFLTTMVFNPKGYGRVIGEDGNYSIVEEKDCNDEQRQVSKINAGVYLFDREFLAEYIQKVPKSPVTGELYLPEVIRLACENGFKVNAVPCAFDDVRGVNNLQELWEVEQIKRSEFIKYWMMNGVRFELAQSIHIDIDVKIGAGSFIGTGSHLLGHTVIGEECFVAAFSIIENTNIGDNTVVHSHSVIQNSNIGTNVHVGPFARLRDNVAIGNDVTIGNFVEVKNSQLGDSTKTKHLSYVGDSTVGKNVNIGAGTIVCNYDGISKNKTIIEDDAFIGSNATLIAPVKIGKGAYTAGGSTINQDVPAECLAIGRAKQVNKDGYATKLRQGDECEELGRRNITLAPEEYTKSKVNFQGATKTGAKVKETL